MIIAVLVLIVMILTLTSAFNYASMRRIKSANDEIIRLSRMKTRSDEVKAPRKETILELPALYFAPDVSAGFRHKLTALDPRLTCSTIRTGSVGALAMCLFIRKPTQRYYPDGSGPMCAQFHIRCFDAQLPEAEAAALELALRNDVIGSPTMARMDSENDPSFTRSERLIVRNRMRDRRPPRSPRKVPSWDAR